MFLLPEVFIRVFISMRTFFCQMLFYLSIHQIILSYDICSLSYHTKSVGPMGFIVCLSPSMFVCIPLRVAHKLSPLFSFCSLSESSLCFLSSVNESKMARKKNVLEIVQVAPQDLLFRPCADCGLRTGSWCDSCLAADRFPKEEWSGEQNTPLYMSCDHDHRYCHFCCGQS